MGKTEILRYWYIIALILSVIFLGYQVYQSTLYPEMRSLNFLYIESGAILILLITAYMMVFFKEKAEKSATTTIVFIFLIARILTMMFFASMPELQTQISYYVHMGLFVSATLMLMNLANILLIERNKRQGFDIQLSGNSSIIPDKIIGIPSALILYPLAFLIMIGAVGFTGSSFVPTPTFAITDGLARPIITSVGVSAWENYGLIFIPMEFVRFIVLLLFSFGSMKRDVWKEDGIIIKGIMLIAGIVTFAAHHLYVYGLNTIALISVSMFGALAGIVYLVTGLPLIADAFHDGNNFGAIYFNAKVYGLSSGVLGASDILLNSIILFGVAIFFILSLFYYIKRKRR